jgi:hypothetical protein
MPLGNMRANGVRSLDVCCWLCHHRAILSAHRPPQDRARAGLGAQFGRAGFSKSGRVSGGSAGLPARWPLGGTIGLLAIPLGPFFARRPPHRPQAGGAGATRKPDPPGARAASALGQQKTPAAGKGTPSPTTKSHPFGRAWPPAGRAQHVALRIGAAGTDQRCYKIGDANSPFDSCERLAGPAFRWRQRSHEGPVSGTRALS